MRASLGRVYHCKWCSEGSGLILPEDLRDAIRMPDGLLKCKTCVDLDHRDRIVKVTPSSRRAQEIKAEDKYEVDKHNQAAHHLNQSSGLSLMRYKRYRYQ
jgi:hypothetical protein